MLILIGFTRPRPARYSASSSLSSGRLYGNAPLALASATNQSNSERDLLASMSSHEASTGSTEPKMLLAFVSRFWNSRHRCCRSVSEDLENSSMTKAALIKKRRVEASSFSLASRGIGGRSSSSSSSSAGKRCTV